MLEKFLDAAKQEGLQPFAIEVCKEDEVIERWEQEAGRRYPVYSATKSFTSTAVGLAVDEGKIALDEPLETFFPAELSKADPAGSSRWRAVTVRQLLTMSVPGLPFRPSGDDWLLDCFSRPIGEERHFSYSNLPAYLAGVAVERAVGEPTDRYLQRKLFSVLDIPRPAMQFCPGGHFYGATGMELTVHEVGTLGRLYLNQGVWKGQRVLSETWCKEAVSRQVMNREGGYGYFFWVRPDGGFTIRGKWGQRCYVFPKERVVVTWLSHLPEQERSDRQEELFFRNCSA